MRSLLVEPPNLNVGNCNLCVYAWLVVQRVVDKVMEVVTEEEVGSV
jgi:hypothetical protein